MGLADLRQYSSSVRIAGRGRFLAVRAEQREHAMKENMTVAEAYKYCLELERDRERKWRKTSKGAFESSFRSLDEFTARFEKSDKIAAFSDKGRAADQIVRGGEKYQTSAVNKALKLLSDDEKTFVRAVLSGKGWKDLGMPKRTFNWKIKKICFCIAHPPEITPIRLRGV